MTPEPQMTERTSTGPVRGVTDPASAADPSHLAIMRQISEGVASGHAERALALASRHRTEHPLIANAMGVCLMRSGRIAQAVALYRSLVLSAGCTWMRQDRPNYVKTNYATALLLAGHPDGCLDVLQELGDESPTAQRLREAIRRWEMTLSFGQKLDWWINRVAPVGVPVRIDFAPGDFGPVEDSDSPTTRGALPPGPPANLCETIQQIPGLC